MPSTPHQVRLQFVRSGIAMLLVAVAMVNLSSACAASPLLSRTNYASVPLGADEYEYWRVQAKSPDRVTYVTDPTGQRGTVQRVEVRPGDNNVFGSGDRGERAEVTRLDDLGGFVDGQTFVMSWGLFIDSSFASPPGGWNNFVQVHGSGGVVPSPWELNLEGDEADLKMRLYGGNAWTSEPAPVGKLPEGSVGEWISLGLLPKNRWNDFVIEVRLGCTGTGYARVWLNGQQMADAENRMIGYCGDPGLYWKQGFYRSLYDKTTQLWFSDTFRWATIDDALANYGWQRQA